jgi:exodeoxyribonuclease V alpha subunit
MNWQSMIQKYAGLSLSDGIIVAKVLEYFPLSSSAQSDYQTLFTALLSLHMHQQQGNTCLPLAKVAGTAVFNTPLNLDTSITENSDEQHLPGFELPAIDSLTHIIRQWLNSFDEKPPYELIDGYLFIQRYYEYEKEIAERLLSFNTSASLEISESAKAVFDSMFSNTNRHIDNADWQAVAVANALQRQFMVLNGGPGTGKTYTVARLLIMLQCVAPTIKVQLVAPTGKAAQRLSESLKGAITELSSLNIVAPFVNKIETEANTIHKVIGTRPGSTQTSKNEQRTLNCGLLVIDEFSMVDTALFAKVLRACKPNTRILLVGDSAQLPSVEAGNLLGDLAKAIGNSKSQMASDFIYSLTGLKTPVNANESSDHIVTLERNHRSNALINTVAKAIQRQNIEQIKTSLGSNNVVVDTINEVEYLALQKDKLKPLLNTYFSVLQSADSPLMLLDALKQFRILSPIRKGPQGIEQINSWINQYLFARELKASKPLNSEGAGLFHGQTIMITENDASTGLRNGDVGLIWRQKDRLVAFIERDNTVPLQLSINRLPKYETAFALTIHKTQGSEYNQVLIVLPYHSTQGCARELLYTGVTRAKENVQLLARECILIECFKRSNKRDTYLSNLLTDMGWAGEK